MFCENCGSVTKEGDEFCPKCGSRLKRVQPQPQAQRNEPTQKMRVDDMRARENRVIPDNLAEQQAEIKKIWPDWTLVEKIGEGSFGQVYKAKREEIGTAFYSAIKIIRIPKNPSDAESVRTEIGLDNQSTTAYFRGLVDECVNEIKLMESLKGTQNIVSVEDYKVVPRENQIGWTIYIRMELLTSFISHVGDRTLSEKEVIKLGIDMCNALEFCARLNVMHRDIKPENIFISSFGIYKLGDFGIARKLEKSTVSLSKKGTYNYMAPEVYNGKTNYDFKSDIYSLGIVLYKLLNNNRFPLVDARSNSITYQQMQLAFDSRMSGAPLPKPLNASDALSSVILTACAFEPGARFATANALKTALINVQNGTADKAVNYNKPPVVRPNVQNQNPRAAKMPAQAARDNEATMDVFNKRAPVQNQPFAAPMPANNAAASFTAPKKPKKTKKKMSKGKKALIIILTVLISLAVAAGGLTIFWFTSSEQVILRALGKEDYTQALDVYNNNFTGGASDLLVWTLNNRLDSIQTDFFAGTVEYEVANMEISTIEEMNIAAIAEKVTSVKDAMSALNLSRTAYNTAETMFGKEDYAGAIENYKKVIESDANYEAAKGKLATTVEKYREVVLKKAADYVADGSYTKAITELETALQVITDDTKLTEQINVYRNDYAAYMKDEALKTAEEYAKSSDWENAVKSIRTALVDLKDDVELKKMLDEYSKKYVESTIAKVDELTGDRKYAEALDTLEAAEKFLPDNEELSKKTDEVDEKKPVSVRDLTTLNSDGSWNDNVTKAEDALGYTYYDSQNMFIAYQNSYGEYYVNGKYTLITGNLTSWYHMQEGRECNLQIYADDKVIYTSPIITQKTKAFDFSVDIPKDTQYLKFVCVSNGYSYSEILITDLLLWTE